MLLFAAQLSSCSDDTPTSGNDNKQWQEYTVAVVLPQERGLGEHWQRCLGLFASNFNSAFHNQQQGVKLKFEYYDELSGDLADVTTS